MWNIPVEPNNLCIDFCTTRCHGCFTETMLEELSFQEILKQVSFGSSCSFVMLMTVHMRQVIRQILLLGRGYILKIIGSKPSSSSFLPACYVFYGCKW